MAIVLERFGSVTLPTLDASQDVGTADSRSGLLSLPLSGAYDIYGYEVAPRESQTLRAHGVVIGTPTERQAQIDALRALRGRREKLYARQDDGTVRWTWARMISLAMQSTIQQTSHQEVDLSLEIADPIWYGSRHGAGWTFDSGETFDTGIVFDEATDDVFTLSHTGTSTITAGNAGDTAITNAVLTFTPGSAAITGFTMTSEDPSSFPQTDLTYSGTIAVGQVLVLDTGAQAAYIPTMLSVASPAADTTLDVVSSAGFVIGRSIEIELLDGGRHHTTIATLPDALSLTITDPLPGAAGIIAAVRMSAYDDLTFGDGQRITEWLRIDPGGTSMVIAITSTQDGSVTFSYSDGWE